VIGSRSTSPHPPRSPPARENALVALATRHSNPRPAQYDRRGVCEPGASSDRQASPQPVSARLASPSHLGPEGVTATGLGPVGVTSTGLKPSRYRRYW